MAARSHVIVLCSGNINPRGTHCTGHVLRRFADAAALMRRAQQEEGAVYRRRRESCAGGRDPERGRRLEEGLARLSFMCSAAQY